MQATDYADYADKFTYYRSVIVLKTVESRFISLQIRKICRKIDYSRAD